MRSLLLACLLSVWLVIAQGQASPAGSSPQPASQASQASNMTVSLSVIDWQAVSAITGAITVLLNIVLVATVVIGYRSLKESVLSRDASLLTWAIQRMAELKDDLETIRHAPPYASLAAITSQSFVSPWDAHVEAAAYRVSVELQRLSYMANSGLLSKIHLQKMWGATFAEAWSLLETWVKYLRLRKGEPVELADGAYRRNDFERFARECQKA
jgi:hypothetical protein